MHAPPLRVYTHPACLLHDTGPQHAERPERLTVVTDALRNALPKLDWRQAPLATRVIDATEPDPTSMLTSSPSSL